MLRSLIILALLNGGGPASAEAPEWGVPQPSQLQVAADRLCPDEAAILADVLPSFWENYLAANPRTAGPLDGNTLEAMVTFAALGESLGAMVQYGQTLPLQPGVNEDMVNRSHAVYSGTVELARCLAPDAAAVEARAEYVPDQMRPLFDAAFAFMNCVDFFELHDALLAFEPSFLTRANVHLVEGVVNNIVTPCVEFL
ncbi:hypothetical protein [Jannaschia sp. CCS1]|uniref:hypothetical protein n=1 Tax=Jannaschia sp. (strain CCS1) TaxID=290400 RepID=UPI000053DE27|nr:hypothetical protein [Jannaschia sp. CCS1]ABD54103.1 hypothetical protein Jann_1186 [Jannaschia sp. CCS1]